MKALLYKELKLAMHPICYVFLFTFPFMALIPSYPMAISYIYVLSAYPILFLGANKGQQSNDLLFSTLLPIRKKDIVLARIFTIGLYQLAFILMNTLMLPFVYLIRESIVSSSGKPFTGIGASVEGYISLIAFVLIGFSITDLIFLPIYYKNGKSIVLPTLISILVFALFVGITTIALPYVPVYGPGLFNGRIGLQIVFLAVALLLYYLMHLLTFKLASKNLEKVDF